MNTYHLTRRSDGRVVLDLAKEKDTDVLQIIKAKSWLHAREKVNELQLWHNPGYGWFER